MAFNLKNLPPCMRPHPDITRSKFIHITSNYFKPDSYRIILSCFIKLRQRKYIFNRVFAEQRKKTFPGIVFLKLFYRLSNNFKSCNKKSNGRINYSVTTM